MNVKKIRVTAKDIALGERHSYCACPIARAVRRAFHGRKITVRHEAVMVGDLEDPRFWIADVAPVVGRFISNFDSGKRVKPAEFVMSFR